MRVTPEVVAEPPCCANCRYSRMTQAAEKVLVLTCNYNPPKFTHVIVPAVSGYKWDAAVSFPPVQKEYWCGKHERNKH